MAKKEQKTRFWAKWPKTDVILGILASITGITGYILWEICW